MNRKQVLPLGLTAILVGYLSVWLPGPSAGLRFIGVEIGEWVKFLPEVQAGNVVPGRDLFYLPPITLALLLILLSAEWSSRRWPTWALRGTAVVVSLLAFPSLGAIQREPSSEWAVRLGMIGVVVVLAVGIGLVGRRLPWRWLMVGVAVVGALLPTWAYLAIRPGAVALIQLPIGIGWGVWLNLLGHGAVGLTQWLTRPENT